MESVTSTKLGRVLKSMIVFSFFFGNVIWLVFGRHESILRNINRLGRLGSEDAMKSNQIKSHWSRYDVLMRIKILIGMN